MECCKNKNFAPNNLSLNGKYDRTFLKKYYFI